MDWLDVILLIVVVFAALRGLRLGAAVQFLSFGGMLVGFAIGAGLVLLICPHVHTERVKTFLALLLLLVPAATLGGLGRQLGAGLWKRLRNARFGVVDAVAGAAIAVAGTLVVVWLLASILSNSEYALVSNQIANSRVIRAVGQVMPPIPTALAPVERFLSAEGLPQVYVDLAQAAGPVAPASSAQVAEASRLDAGATVKVVAIGCDQIQEGSGFVVAPGLVVTNAHVVAGTHEMTVHAGSAVRVATVVLFDPEFDLAVLRVPRLSTRPLTLDPDIVGRGTRAVVLGYPGGGNYTADPAGVLLSWQATGLDIYGTRTTVRTVYEVQALVRPGNSGGPLVEPDGAVIGVVFSRSETRADIGYALTTPGVLYRVHEAERLPAGAVSGTGACITG